MIKKKTLLRNLCGLLALTGCMSGRHLGPLEPVSLNYSHREPLSSLNTEALNHAWKRYEQHLDQLNQQRASSPFAEQSLEKLILTSQKLPEFSELSQLACETYSEGFFLQSLSPVGGRSLALRKLDTPFRNANQTLGGVRQLLISNACTDPHPGFTWLTLNHGKYFKVINLPPSETPQMHLLEPLLCIDMRDQNEPFDFINRVFEKNLNWAFAYQNYLYYSGPEDMFDRVDEREQRK